MAMYDNNKDNPKSRVTTDGIGLWSDETAMRLDYWNQHVSIKMSPRKDPTDPSPGMYNYKIRNQLTLQVPDAITFGTMIKEDFIPACKKGEAKHFGIQTSKMNVIYISNGIEETGHLEPYVALFCGIDESRKPGKTSFFKFRSKRVFTKYDYTTGDFELREDFLADVAVFADFLLSAIDIAGAPAHGFDIAHVNEKDRDDAFYSAIGLKLGVQYNQPVNYVNGGNFGGDPWGRPATVPEDGAQIDMNRTAQVPSMNPIPAPQQAPTATISSANMDDLNSLLGSRMVTNVKGLDEHLLFGKKLKSKKIKFITA